MWTGLVKTKKRKCSRAEVSKLGMLGPDCKLRILFKKKREGRGRK